jgi:monoamine oxidase
MEEIPMKGLNYSNLTAVLRRIHQASLKSEETGIPVDELLGQDRQLRQQLQHKRLEDKQRRDFMKTLGGIGLGASLMPMANTAMAMGGQNDPEIAIIGAGAGGLRTAHRLMKYGISSKIYEANTRIGGRMYSNTDFFSDNRVVEWGGEFISSEHTAIRNLAHQLGLSLEDANKLSVGDEETYFIGGQLYSEANLLDEWVGGLYNTMKQALKDAPWQPMYNSTHTPEHIMFDQMNAIQYMESIGYSSSHWVHKLLLTDLVAEYGLLEENSALNLIYLLGWNTRNSGGLPLAGTDERLHVVGGNDLIIHGMADELPAGTIQLDRALEAVVGDRNGPYTLVFNNGPDETCEALVLALPYGLLRNIDIDTRITSQFIPQKNDAIAQILESDNGKVQMEFSDKHWDMSQVIDSELVHQAARAYSDPDKFISTWEGEPGNPSTLGLLVDYTGGVQGKNLGGVDFFGVADPNDVNNILAQVEPIWPGITGKYNGKAIVSNWWDNPFSKGAFVSPSVNVMTQWWGAQWETEGNMYFAGEACDEEYWSYMNGAILSGERVAKEIHQS